MSTIQCQFHNHEGDALTRAPIPGPLGEKIKASCCREAWQEWLIHQTRLINEYRLNIMEPSAIELLEKEMEKFFFGDGSENPEGYQA